ncbi:hypothetical protein BHE74_00023547 [Ensete ventricosum]|nr:hypothetical protein GW17_00054177 [Ensete ventricosum]RWW68894.1 hypothetical protein BHE74_00023547 [Ensete ventricosum]RZR79328.1 hypothetical protein BHM03_00005033 [Ensete ventricosum]
MVHYRPKSPISVYKTPSYLQAKISHKANQNRAAKPTSSPLLAVQGKGAADHGQASARAAGLGQALCSGGRLRPGSPARAVSRPTHKGQRWPVANPQRGGAHRSAACGHDTRSPVRCRPRIVAPTAGVAANSAQRYRLRTDDDSGRRKAAAMARVSIFWQRTILPL